VELLRAYSNQRFTLAELAPLLDAPRVARPVKTVPKQRQHHLTAREKADLVDRYRRGERAHELAAAFEIDRRTVAKLLVHAGIRRPRSLTANEVIEAARLYEAGWSCAKVGEQLGRRSNTIWLALRAAGVAMRDCHGRERGAEGGKGPGDRRT
jgi:hypothetical protein